MYRAFADSCIDCPPGVYTESIKRLVCVLIFRHVRSRLLEPVRCCCLHGLCSLEPRDSENTCVCKHGYFRQSAIQCTQCPYARTTLSENSLQLRDCVCNAGYTKSSDSCIHLMHDSRVLMTTVVPCRHVHAALWRDFLSSLSRRFLQGHLRCRARAFPHVSRHHNSSVCWMCACVVCIKVFTHVGNARVCSPSMDVCNTGMPVDAGDMSPCACDSELVKTDATINNFVPKYAQAGDGTCIDCPSNSISAEGSTSCLCNAGYTGSNGGTCSACPSGKFQSSAGLCVRTRVDVTS